MSKQNLCEYCGEVVRRDPNVKRLRGTKHVFCSESCYILYRFNVPKMDRFAVYEKTTINRNLGDATKNRRSQ